jgi:hypothetical protein
MPDNVNVGESQPNQKLARDAAEFLSRLPIIRQLLDSVSLEDVARGFCFDDAKRGIFGRDALNFTAYGFGLDAEDLRQELQAAGVDSEAIGRVQQFLRDHALLRPVVRRSLRLEFGYSNELTSLRFKPVLYLASGRRAFELRIFSHDHQVLRCVQEVGGILEFVTMLLDAIADSFEDADKIAPSLGAGALDKDEKDESLAELFRQVYRMAKGAAPESEPMKELLEAVRQGLERIDSGAGQVAP